MSKTKIQNELEIFDKTSEQLANSSRKTHKKKANELDGKTWVKYSISVWNDIAKSREELKLNHPAMFPSQLPARLIEIFTNNEMKVILDPFLGTGSTLIASKALGKLGFGFEISEEYIKIAHERLGTQISFFSEDIKQKIIHDDARNLLKYLDKNSVDLCITSPPYWDILEQKRTADYKETRNYSEKEGNLGSIKEYGIFLIELKKIFEIVCMSLKPGAYCCVIVMDLRKKNRFYSFHSDIASFMEDIGFSLEDIIIWDRRREYNMLRPLGYPSVFRVNKIHEYILIFKKPRARN